MLGQALKQDFPRDVTGLQDTGVGERVTHLSPNPFTSHDPALTHDRQVLADLGLSLSRRSDQLLDRLRSCTQQRKQSQARGIGEGLVFLAV